VGGVQFGKAGIWLPADFAALLPGRFFSENCSSVIGTNLLFVIGYLLFVIGYLLLVIGYWLLVIGYWLFVIGYLLFVIGYLLFVTIANN